MKKVLAVAAVCIMCVAGTALARTSADNPARMMPRQRMEQEMPGRMMPPQRADRRMPAVNECPNMPAGHEAPMPRRNQFGNHKGTFTPDMPKEIREKAAELAKLRIDLEEAMTSRPLNKEKALEVHKKMQGVKQEIETWRFTQKLERMEARQKKGLPPMPEEVSPETDEAPEAPETESEE